MHKFKQIKPLRVKKSNISFKMFQLLGVEFTEFFGYSDFTWNQSWRIYMLKICHFYTFWALNFSFLWHFALFEVSNLENEQNSKPLNLKKPAVLVLLDSPKLIWRKILKFSPCGVHKPFKFSNMASLTGFAASVKKWISSWWIFLELSLEHDHGQDKK